MTTKPWDGDSLWKWSEYKTRFGRVGGFEVSSKNYAIFPI